MDQRTRGLRGTLRRLLSVVLPPEEAWHRTPASTRTNQPAVQRAPVHRCAPCPHCRIRCGLPPARSPYGPATATIDGDRTALVRPHLTAQERRLRGERREGRWLPLALLPEPAGEDGSRRPGPYVLYRTSAGPTLVGDARDGSRREGGRRA